MFSNLVFENRAVYEIMRKNTADSGRPQIKTGRMRIACWIPKATNTNSEYAILTVFLIARTPLNVTVYATLPVLFVWCWSGYVSGKLRTLIDPLYMH